MKYDLFTFNSDALCTYMKKDRFAPKQVKAIFKYYAYSNGTTLGKFDTNSEATAVSSIVEKIIENKVEYDEYVASYELYKANLITWKTRLFQEVTASLPFITDKIFNKVYDVIKYENYGVDSNDTFLSLLAKRLSFIDYVIGE